MLTKEAIVEKAVFLGFEDVGFTTAHPFDEHREFLEQRQAEYGWAERAGLKLLEGADPKSVLPDAQTIIVLLEVYFKKAFPRSMEAHFGRCYLDDDRVTKDGLSRRIKAFRGFLRDHGINSKVPYNLPHRMSAARAGMGTFGKNCLFYSNRAARKSSWNLPIAVVVDREFSPGHPTLKTDCPEWCRNACISACPTRALKGNARIDPGKCISYLSYFGEGITPLELREPMGMYVYGCDRCQNVCPRNQAWLARELPVHEKVEKKAGDFNLSALLHMDKAYFETKIWPHMFYMSYRDIWRWKMNVARVMGNTGDEMYIPDLVRAFNENTDDRIRGMVLWALGRMGGKKVLTDIMNENKTLSEEVARELNLALEIKI
jgi:epoxyqueuosine reductase